MQEQQTNQNNLTHQNTTQSQKTQTVGNTQTIPTLSNQERPKKVYQCDICHDEGFIFYKKRGYGDEIYEYSKRCECQIAKENQKNIEKSDLSEIYRRCTFANYIVGTKEQGEAKEKAVGFYRECTNPNPVSTAYGMLFYGQSGAGKTHLAISTLNNFLQYGKTGLYVNYLELVRKLSQFSMDYMQYNQEISKCISVDVLLIDDLFKSKSNSDISSAKLTYMIEIINHRYYNKK